MLPRTRLRPPIALIVGAALALGLTACTGLTADVPDDAVQESSTVPTTEPTSSSSSDPEDAARIARLITDCLARYGLGERPPLASPLADDQDRIAAQRARDAYDSTLTNCSAQALASPQPGTDSTGEPRTDPTGEPGSDSAGDSGSEPTVVPGGEPTRAAEG
ncbi:hypothetical protein C5C18_10715 [Rathayibacter tritici]|uniref:Uncharacterized protein n=1 Tax=Rathayibacter tritici TaxID=33888 RepID=A0A169C347_9MICO|nr:hypothetical protein [Rathayibacter tritici]AND17255.1 hypothetical protein A6122_2131 [Rathayibacter tritici]PPF29165.1 hypothetical protein C5C06_06935 [Rathayibacter tritici]PPF66281.1 hypothetical protein C5C21_09505 [Rathayibacter tritici]PPG06340.1 hypothetical protein C5C18_10715 [Rathayibacter tritici]PPI11557.1 hypothetical protein C5D07_14075 [Rathayibacter tritici]